MSLSVHISESAQAFKNNKLKVKIVSNSFYTDSNFNPVYMTLANVKKLGKDHYKRNKELHFGNCKMHIHVPKDNDYFTVHFGFECKHIK